MRYCEVCGHAETSEGQPTHTASFCWEPGCEIRHPFMASLPTCPHPQEDRLTNTAPSSLSVPRASFEVCGRCGETVR